MDTKFEKFSEIADPNETFNWIDRPNAICFIVVPALKLGFIGIAMILFHFLIAKSPIIIFAIIFLILAFISYFYLFFLYSNTYYTYSSKRIIIKTGVLGTDYTIVDFNKISDYKVTVGPVENFFGVGSIHIFTPSNTERKQISFKNVPLPYQVFKNLKAIINNSHEY